jgi:hypothetical protein
MMLGIIIFFYILKYFGSGSSGKNTFEMENGNVVVTPFLIRKNNEGNLFFSTKKNRLLYKIIAIVLILFFLIIPMSKLLPDGSFINGFYY